MKIGLHLFGFNHDLLTGIPEKTASKQIFVFNMLACMLLFLSLLAFGAGIIYGLIIFNQWAIAIAFGVFLGGVVFLLIQYILFLSMQTRFQKIREQLLDMEMVFEKYPKSSLISISDEEALEMVSQHRLMLRNSALQPGPPPFHLSRIVLSGLFISLLLVVSFVIANAFEVLMYKNSLNHAFQEIKNSKPINELAKSYDSPKNQAYLDQKLEAIWTLKMVTPPKSQDFKFIHCHSILMVFDVLAAGIGSLKIWLDLLFASLFLIPYLLVMRSPEFSGGALLKEMALEQISTSLLMHILSSREQEQIKHKIETQFDYLKSLSN